MTVAIWRLSSECTKIENTTLREEGAVKNPSPVFSGNQISPTLSSWVCSPNHTAVLLLSFLVYHDTCCLSSSKIYAQAPYYQIQTCRVNWLFNLRNRLRSFQLQFKASALEVTLKISERKNQESAITSES